MLSKNKQKLITSLSKKKFRDNHQLFIAEGSKLVCDLLENGMICSCLIATEAWLSENESLSKGACETISTDIAQIKKVTQLKSPPPVIGLFEQKKDNTSTVDLSKQLVLLLDDVQDPGNLGTIIRLADWFGIRHLFCSQGCADIYNHKTIQSTMGAVARVQVHYIDPLNFLTEAESSHIPVYGTFLEGENIYSEKLSNNGIIIMGNEGKGIRPEFVPFISKKLFIPNYPADAATSESLNVSIATAIICSEFRRRSL